MASYKIEWKQSAQKEIRKLEKKTISRILQTIATLSENPYPSGNRKLHGAEYTYRLRVGDYRIIYSVFSDILTIEIVRIGHRKEIYRSFT
jgi:mRNA interferase RelE/StbE